jgi:hypothetical protein
MHNLRTYRFLEMSSNLIGAWFGAGWALVIGAAIVLRIQLRREINWQL